MDIELFNFLRKLIETEDGLILYALALIVIMEIVDFSSVRCSKAFKIGLKSRIFPFTF